MKITKVFCQRKFRTVIAILCLSFISYITHIWYDYYAYQRYVRWVHKKEYAAEKYYASPERTSPTPADQYFVEHIPYFSKHLQGYIRKIEDVRSRMLSIAHRGKPSVAPAYTLVDGYDENFFAILEGNPQVETVFLAINENEVDQILPVKKYFDYGSNALGCERGVKLEWAVYHNGFELYNKTCRTNLRETLVPRSIDRKSLSVGLPFQLSAIDKAPTGHPPSNLILTFVNIVSNAFLSSNGDVFVNDTCIKTQRCNKEIRYPKNNSKIPYYEEVLTITEQGTIWYYHMTVEDLPRIAPYILFLRNNPQIKIHVSLSGYHLEMLAELGFGTDRIIWGDVSAKIVYLPAGTTCGRPSVFTTSLMSYLLRQAVEKRIGKQKQDSIVILERADSYRQFKHHDEIHQAVQKLANEHNLRVQIFSDRLLPSLRVGMEIFYRAKAVIGPHGSGMANMIFTQPRTVVIEGLCYMENWYYFCLKAGFIPWLCVKPASRFSFTFRNIAATLGLHYYGIVRKDDCLYTTPEEVVTPLRYYLEHLQ